MPVRRVRREAAEEELDERPTRRASRDQDEPEDERPARRPARDEDEEERPARRRPRDDEEEEEERPRRRRPRDDEEEEEPDEDSTGAVRAGWDGYKHQKAKGGDFPEELKITDEPELVKFLEEGPFASYRQHWIDNPPNGIRKKSWTCVETDCPLCDMGDRPRLLTAFNIVHLSTGGDPENKILVLGTKATGQLLNFAEDRKTGPLSKLYYALSKTGKNQATAYNIVPVKERDLKEDWDMEPLSDDELDEAEAKMYDATAIQTPSRKQLKELASGLSDDD
jgi:hypothetical protein